jgi:hypothetical protein
MNNDMILFSVEEFWRRVRNKVAKGKSTRVVLTNNQTSAFEVCDMVPPDIGLEIAIEVLCEEINEIRKELRRKI